MALTFRDQIKIIEGEPFPDLEKFISIGAVTYANQFLTNHKVFDSSVDQQTGIQANAEAASYLSKMLGFANAILNYERDNKKFILDSIKRNFVVIMAIERPNVDYSQVTGKPDYVWESFITDQMPTIFERMSGITLKEIQSYASV